mmetsp:Transcript_103612/g.179967  ORF Transcript_103612/g.179967 Transcript_103612/m.179967 type:complete len:102 (-) Transcript_103612:625-930(-)
MISLDLWTGLGQWAFAASNIMGRTTAPSPAVFADVVKLCLRLTWQTSLVHLDVDAPDISVKMFVAFKVARTVREPGHSLTTQTIGDHLAQDAPTIPMPLVA